MYIFLITHSFSHKDSKDLLYQHGPAGIKRPMELQVQGHIWVQALNPFKHYLNTYCILFSQITGM